jgi:Na+-transporting NADH:ubiquinone oxidoreductase subunit A
LLLINPFKNRTKTMSKTIKITKGLNIPLKGDAEKTLSTAPRSSKYSVCPTDFHGLTPKMLVKEGDRVKAGTPLFFDKYNERIIYNSPVSGTFSHLVRGDKRRILKVIIDAEPIDEYIDYGIADPQTQSREKIIGKLLECGLWPSIRQRPYTVVANPAHTPKSIFVSAFDSAPLAADLDFIVQGQEMEFQTGLNALSRLTSGKVHLGMHADFTQNKAFTEAKNVETHFFKGPHPAGNVGIQIHHVDPINKGEIVWYVGVQHVIMMGRLFLTGKYDATKIIALAGSEVAKPSYFKVVDGARISEIVHTKLRTEPEVKIRLISGDVLCGTKMGDGDFLRYYDNMITAIPEGDKPEVLGWIVPGFDKYSTSKSFPAFLMRNKKYRIDTNTRGGERPFVLTGIYEKVLPMDILPMHLLKSIMINDIDMMEKLGIYEVAPEDFALCEYVCPSKIDIQDTIREGLDIIRQEFS